MSAIIVEMKKHRRSGLVPVMFGAGILGFLYSVAFFTLHKESVFLSQPQPMTVLLTRLYGVVLMLNLFGIIMASSLIFNIEFQDNAIRKMITLPINMTNIYGSKCTIIFCSLLANIVLQRIALCYIGVAYLPEATFEIAMLLSNSVYLFVATLPTASFMMLIASRIENFWVSIGVGIAGFFSGMVMAMGDNSLLLANPFVLIMKPVVVALDSTVIIVSIVETILFFIIGMLLAKYSKYE